MTTAAVVIFATRGEVIPGAFVPSCGLTRGYPRRRRENFRRRSRRCSSGRVIYLRCHGEWRPCGTQRDGAGDRRRYRGHPMPGLTGAFSWPKADKKRTDPVMEVSAYANLSSSRRLRFAVVLASSLTASCAVGPDFKRPDAPSASEYTAHPVSSTVATANVAGGESQRFAKGSDIPGDWWTLFHSTPLNELIEQSLANNPRPQGGAGGVVGGARENVLAQRGAYYPSVGGQLLGQPPEAIGVDLARRPTPMPFCTTCSPRRSAFPTCPTFSA